MRVFGSKMSQGPRKHLWVVKSQVQFCVANMAWHVKEYIGCVGSDRRSRGIHLKKAHFISPPPTHSWRKANPPENSIFQSLGEPPKSNDCRCHFSGNLVKV